MYLELFAAFVIGYLLSAVVPFRRVWAFIYVRLFRTVVTVTGIQKYLDKEMDKSFKGIEESLRIKEFDDYVEIPEHGIPKEKLLELLHRYAEYDEQHVAGRHISGSMYNGSAERKEVTSTAVKLFVLSNPLHADDFPSVRKMEAEVIRMTANMLHAPPEVAGLVTTGGTESLILSVRAHYVNAVRNNGFDPLQCEVIMCENAHPGWLKGCDLMHITPVMIPIDEKGKMSPDAVQRAITPRTILIVSSAPSYPHGVVDDIPALGAIGKKYHIPVHVDACLGGFVQAWGRDLGFNVPPFDFEVEGVSSISCDTHKYGYAPKGTSVLLFESAALRNLTFFRFPKWMGGLYCSPSIPGSRAGSPIAGAWAALLYTGREGYAAATRGILETARRMKEALARLPNVRLLCDPAQDTSVVAFTLTDLNIYKVSDCMMRDFKWELNNLQAPAAVHFCVTEKTIGCEEAFIRDFLRAIEIVRDNQNDAKYNVWAPVYGMTANIPDNVMLEDMVAQVIALYCDVI